MTLVERQRALEHKVCGDFLSGEAQSVLADLGIDLAAMGARPADRLRFVSGKQSALAALPFTGVSVSRRALDEALLVAAERAGAVVLRGQSASALQPDGSGVGVKLGNHTLAAGTAVLATGKHNLRGLPRRTTTATAFKMVFEPSAASARLLDRTVQLASYRGGYIGSCIIEDGALSVCWLASPGFLREAGHDWRGQLDWISRRTPDVGDLVAGAAPLLKRPVAVSAIPFGYRRQQAAARNIYAVGDQLACIHSFTGDGTSIALMSGVAAARALAVGRPAGEFQRDFLRAVRAPMQMATLVGGTFASAFGRWSGIAMVSALPQVATILARATRIGAAASEPARLQVDDHEVGGEAGAESSKKMAAGGA